MYPDILLVVKMGKRNKHKSVLKSNDNPIKNKDEQKPKIPFHISKELNELVATLFNVASVINTTSNVNKEWELFQEIEKILASITAIESEYFPSERLERTEQTLTDLIAWAKEHGVEMDAIGIKEFEGYGYGVSAEQDIEEGDPIVKVPRKLMITSDTIMDSPLKNLYQSNPIIRLMPNVALALFILHEKFRGDESFWRPYINFLPPHYSTVLYFKSQDLLHMKGSPTFESAMKQCRNIFRQYAHFKRLFQNGDDEVSKLFRAKFTYEEYRWAVSTVMTRLNAVPSENEASEVHALIPIWDMCNHENGRVFTYYNPVHHVSECFSHRHFSAGSQVFIFYGVRRNADFLVHSGFYYPDNGNDGVKILLGISKSDPAYESRIRLLNRLRISATADFILSRAPDCGVEGPLLAFLRVFNMTREQVASHLERREEELQSLLEFPGRVDDYNETKTREYLATRIKLLLSAYPTTVESDQERLKDSNLSPYAAMAVQLCLSEKLILQNTLAFIKELNKIM